MWPLLMFVKRWKFPLASRKTLGSSDFGEVIGNGLIVSYWKHKQSLCRHLEIKWCVGSEGGV